ADRNRSHWSTSKTPSYTKSVSWQHHLLPYPLPHAFSLPLLFPYGTAGVYFFSHYSASKILIK
ncbi:hypothetical protein LVR53_12360, partial [Klebsiella pneumoniae]|nr:hypothetical protein [Klebsiella pneumoniae]MCD9712003.1 hypothetical protein [Klebsiella pneumoniae]